MRERCPRCTRTSERYRGTATSRGYGTAWRVFCRTFTVNLIGLGIAPECGATLPGGPVTADSRCKAERRHTTVSHDGSDLHRDHEPPLQDHERQNQAVVCDPLRIQLLCKACHSAKTAREQGTATRTM